ncbi:hypothetical protein LAZ67_2003405 [Cordylochernes scorpioides]|uniref:Uncharacterized protein n=1 Tax=Cordylochernes scorpioides TaxID=51811 RepID=A0ABY6K689_9ARAC|nr:hypothetical protein LAZ67_2003405 [Cordylochernes scorpioides]
MPGHRKRRQFKQTDAFTRGMVIGLKRAGNVAIYRNVGATRVTSARVDRRILRQAVAAPQATCTAILQHVQDTLDHSISTRTISRRLVVNGLHSCRPLRRLPLTPPNRRQRLEWCRARSTWMTEWHRVVFSDESRFCLSSDSRRVRVWRRRGERSNPAAIVERPTVRQRGNMGTMTAQRYVDDVVRPVTLPYLQGVPNALYQQDNARPHTARISQQDLQDVQMLPWPPYSPDLSPIEHVWDIIGRRLHALPQPRSEDELWQMVEREWRAIPQDAIRTLIDSLPRRVAACIAVREGFNFGKPNEWPIWFKRFQRYRIASGLSEKSENEQDYFIGKRNVIYERAKFNRRSQGETEPVEEFITNLYVLAENCSYGILKEEMIRDRNELYTHRKYIADLREEDGLIWSLMLDDEENDGRVLEEERDTVIHYYEKWIDLEIKANHFLSSLMKDTEALHGASSKKGSLPGTGVCRLPKLDMRIYDGSSLEFRMSKKPRVVGVTLMKGVDPASIKEDAGIVVSSEKMVEETSTQIAVEENKKALVEKRYFDEESKRAQVERKCFAEKGKKAQVKKKSVVKVDESHRAEVEKESVEADEEKGLDVEQGMDSKNTEEVKLLYAEQDTDSKMAEKLDAEQGTDSKVAEKLDVEQGTDSKVAERQDADLENGKDSEAETKGNEVGDSRTAIEACESVSNSKAVAEGANQVEISDGEAKSIDDIEERVVRVPASRKLVEARLTGDAEFKVKGCYLPERPVFECGSKTTPIRPVFDDASCRGNCGLALRRYLRRRPSLLRGIPEIRMEFRENKFGVLADMGRYFFRMIAIKENHLCEERTNRKKSSIGKYLPNNKMQLVSKETVSGAVVTPILYTPASSPKGQVPTPAKSLNLGDKSPEKSGKSAKLERIAKLVDYRTIILSGLRSLKKISEYYDCSRPSDDTSEPSDDTSKPSDDTSRPADDASASDPDSSGGKAQGSQEVPEVAVEDTNENDIEVRAQTKSPKAISSKILCMKKEESSIDLEEEDTGRNEPSPASITFKALETTDSKEINLTILGNMRENIAHKGLHLNSPMNTQGVQLHGFGDASEDAYAAAVYIRIPTDEGVRVKLLASKTKLAPIRKMSIPRLELCAALLLTRLMKYIMEELNIKMESAT